MVKGANFLIGLGETLRADAEINPGGGDKRHPYTFDQARERLAQPIKETMDAIDQLPAAACPGDEAVVAITLHPAYLAKSYHPSNLLRSLNLRQVGSRQAIVYDDDDILEDRAKISSELFVAGSRDDLKRLSRIRSTSAQTLKDDFRKLETIRAPGVERLRGTGLRGSRIPLEVVIHVGEDMTSEVSVMNGFEEWCELISGVSIENERQVGALSFVNVYADESSLDELVRFSFLRLARRMPKLAFRAITLNANSLSSSFSVPNFSSSPVTEHVKVAIFDGGLAQQHPFGSLVTSRTPPGIGNALDSGIRHGTQVTSAVLFGPLCAGSSLPQPFCRADHWRVIDDRPDDFELTRTLDYIVNVLNSEDYDIANLSLGPDDALVDDDVHIWTATLDQIAAQNSTLIVTAAGNNGEQNTNLGLDRIQPSSDGVNVLAVGARNTLEDAWTRAHYSAKGPGRSPGLIKPDCVAMGGCADTPFFAIDETGLASATCGTSFASPTVARLAAGLKASYSQLSPTAIRALLIHTSDGGANDQLDVGWGSVRHELHQIITCADDEATVVYQGNLGVQRQMRYPIPCPMHGFLQKVTLKATFVIASPIDPQDTGAYTQVGAQISFRPETASHPGLTSKGKLKAHPSKPFFGQSKMYQTEQDLREDAHRWECVQKSSSNFYAATLNRPVFDIEHLARDGGAPGIRNPLVPYALIVSITEKDNTNLYGSILDAHSSLQAMVPNIDVTV